MFNQIESFDDVKRIIYFNSTALAILYCIFNLLFVIDGQEKWIISFILLPYFCITFVLLKRNLFLHIYEYSALILISAYLIIMFYQAVHVKMIDQKMDRLSDFILWMPLFIIYTFFVFGKKKGLLFSISVFLATFVIGIRCFKAITELQKDSILRYYFANLMYIFVFYMLQHIFGLFAEINFLKNNAFIDSLTETPNRRRMHMYFEEAIEKAQKGKQPLSVIFLDIDHFKRINDQFGHDTGDLVLKEFAALLEHHLSERDQFGRWGGEEFIILTPSCLEKAGHLAERLRRRIEQNDFTIVEQVTSSFGVASYLTGDSTGSLFKRADRALYESKEKGRNRVSLSPSMPISK